MELTDAQLDQIEARLADTRPLPPGSHVQRDPWHAASAIEEILDVHVPALIAEVRALRARIAAAEQPLAPINGFIGRINAWFVGLDAQQSEAVERYMRRSEASAEHDRVARQYRLRRHWGPARLAAARDRKETPDA